MPELPEVENVRQSLMSMGFVGQKFESVELKRAGLRTPFPRDLEKKLKGQTVLAVERRAKYLLFETEKFVVLSHLGMTGSWRSLDALELQKHDHVVFYFESGLKMVFNDPRRFGLLDLLPKQDVLRSPWLKHLGVEPLTEEFHSQYLFTRTRKVRGAIKAFLMDQKRVVGVGNIYASEALFAAGVKPSRPAGRITREDSHRLVASIQRILRAAIEAGGSTIRDYRNSKGEDGSFQTQFRVYDKAKSPCPTCGTAIRSKMIAGRNTFWCPKCQR
jgi:formamidopyrimidine-DNA glycosylase